MSVQPHNVRKFYSLHAKELRRYLTQRLNCAQTADDLTQETFCRLISGRPSEAIENPRAYLYRIASNLVTDHYRRIKHEPQVVKIALGESVVDHAPSPERTLLAQHEVRRLERAIDELPPRQREILLLHKFEGLSYGMIAERLSISKNTVMVHMMRALASCRDRLSED